MSSSFASFSASVSRIVAAAASTVAAIRVGPNRHLTGLLAWNDTIVTTDQALPVQDHYAVVLPSGALVSARPGMRDRNSNVAALRLDAPAQFTQLAPATPVLGGLMIIVGADEDAAPTVRVTVVHRLLRTPGGLAPAPDLAAHQVDQGAAAFDEDGRLLGMLALGPNNNAAVIPNSVIRQAFQATPAPSVSAPTARRGWLGVALQPITVPDDLAARTGQTSGRMVVNITPGGPAERGGLRIGDVLLTLNGNSASGPHAMRAFLSSDKIGAPLEVRLLRDGMLMTAQLVVAPQPV